MQTCKCSGYVISRVHLVSVLFKIHGLCSFFIYGIFVAMQTEKLLNKLKNTDEGTETEISC